MSKLELKNITLLGIDCVNVERLQVAMNISEKEIQFGASKLLTSLPTDDPRAIQIPPISTIEEFSKFCISDLYKYVDTDYVLLVQYDGFVLNPDSWNNDFLKYDYIGAPLSGISWKGNSTSPYVVGNGGFCIRSKKFLEVAHGFVVDGKITKFHPEDVALCVIYRDLFEKEGITFAPSELAMRFSVVEDYGVYNKPFGFHGLFNKNMDTLIDRYHDFPLHYYLPRRRSKMVEKIKKIFEVFAVEGHLFGSLTEGRADDFSDIDVWLTFSNENFSEILEKRFEYYSQVGDIVHICEPHQNAPIDGIQSFVLYKTKVGLITVDYYLCPQSTSFITLESKNLFGDSVIPIGEIKLNPQKKVVSDSYRIDFFICFIFNSIKKIIRKNENALGAVFKEYGYLSEKYGIATPPIMNTENTFTALEQVIENTKKIADEKQNKTLVEILGFIKQVKMYD